jgi:hypothetical protein
VAAAALVGNTGTALGGTLVEAGERKDFPNVGETIGAACFAAKGFARVLASGVRNSGEANVPVEYAFVWKPSGRNAPVVNERLGAWPFELVFPRER